MLKAILITGFIFIFIISGWLVLKRTANSFKVPKGVKPQPYNNDYDEKDESNKSEDSREPKNNGK